MKFHNCLHANEERGVLFELSTSVIIAQKAYGKTLTEAPTILSDFAYTVNIF